MSEDLDDKALGALAALQVWGREGCVCVKQGCSGWLERCTAGAGTVLVGMLGVTSK